MLASSLVVAPAKHRSMDLIEHYRVSRGLEGDMNNGGRPSLILSLHILSVLVSITGSIIRRMMALPRL